MGRFVPCWRIVHDRRLFFPTRVLCLFLSFFFLSKIRRKCKKKNTSRHQSCSSRVSLALQMSVVSLVFFLLLFFLNEKKKRQGLAALWHRTREKKGTTGSLSVVMFLCV
nr:hypothetical protein [Pandoravirus aubagnensis]